MISTPPTLAGLFFCLASDEGAGLLFCPAAIQHHTSGYNTACATLERLTAPGRTPALNRYQRRTGRCTGQHSSPIIIRYIRVQRLLWIHARRCNTSQTMPARRGQLLHLYRVSPAAGDLAPGQPGTLHPAWQSSSQGAAGGAELLAALAAALFGLSPDS